MNENEAVSNLWRALIDVEDYFQHGIIHQLQETTGHFSGENAAPIKCAFRIFREMEPYLSDELREKASNILSVSEFEFNKILDKLRSSKMDNDQIDRDEVLLQLNKQFSSSLNEYRTAMKAVTALIPETLDKGPSSIDISGNIYGPLNIASGDVINPEINVNVSDLIKNIKESNADQKTKNSLVDLLLMSVKSLLNSE